MRIDHPALTQIPGLRALWKEAFGDTDSFLDHFFSTAFSPERCMCISDGETVAAAAYWFDCQIRGRKAAYIYAVATAKSHRGQGLCHQLMEAIQNLLLRRGCCGTMVVPGEASLRAFYAGMGYENFGGISIIPCVCGDAAQLRKLDAAEYAQLRRQYLPEGGVCQEGENLAFLAGFADFYAGEDFLVAVEKGRNPLRGLELLGNIEAGPGITAALGAQTGQFQVPGATPFAMYHPLTDVGSPTYFAFAFD